jgi:hypothetical protein
MGKRGNVLASPVDVLKRFVETDSVKGAALFTSPPGPLSKHGEGEKNTRTSPLSACGEGI